MILAVLLVSRLETCILVDDSKERFKLEHEAAAKARRTLTLYMLSQASIETQACRKFLTELTGSGPLG